MLEKLRWKLDNDFQMIYIILLFLRIVNNVCRVSQNVIIRYLKKKMLHSFKKLHKLYV